VVFGPGNTLFTGDVGGSAYEWDIATHTLTGRLLDPSSQGVITLAFDGSILASGDNNGHTYLWNAASRSLIGSLQAAGVTQQVKTMAFNPAGTILLTGNGNGSVDAWRVATRMLISSLTASH
jgi:WD40 repeat protein